MASGGKRHSTLRHQLECFWGKAQRDFEFGVREFPRHERAILGAAELEFRPSGANFVLLELEFAAISGRKQLPERRELLPRAPALLPDPQKQLPRAPALLLRAPELPPPPPALLRRIRAPLPRARRRSAAIERCAFWLYGRARSWAGRAIICPFARCTSVRAPRDDDGAVPASRVQRLVEIDALEPSLAAGGEHLNVCALPVRVPRTRSTATSRG